MHVAMKLKPMIWALSAGAVFVGSCALAGCKGDRDKNAGSASGGGAGANVTPKDVAANPGDVPQPVNPPARGAAGAPTKPQDAASVAGKREGAGGVSWQTPAG